MTYDSLTPNQKQILTWIVQEIRGDRLREECIMELAFGDVMFLNFAGEEKLPTITISMVRAWNQAGLLFKTTSNIGMLHFVYSVNGRAYEAVDTNFSESLAPSLPDPNITSIEINRPVLAKHLEEYFDLTELEDLCFNAGGKWDNIGGDTTLPSKTRHLIDYMERNGRLLALIIEAVKKREKRDWSFLY